MMDDELRDSLRRSERPGWVLCRVRFFFEPRDLWVGVYWRVDEPMDMRLDIWVCLLPMVPLGFMFLRGWLLRQWEDDAQKRIGNSERTGSDG